MKRFKKILKWTAIVAGVAIAIALIADFLIIRTTGSRLERRLEALRRAGDPVEVADLGRKPIPPETDAHTDLLRVDADLQAVQKGLDGLYPRVGYPQGLPTPAEREKLEALFAAHPQLIPTLERAAAAPDYDPHLDATLPRDRFLTACIDISAQHRPIYRVLRARSELLRAEGKPDEAIAAQLLMLRLARHWRREPMLLAYLVTAVGENTAIEVIDQVLQSGPVSPATRRAIEEEVARSDTMEGYAHALRSERAFSLSMARDIRSGAIWPLRSFTNGLMLGLLDLFDRYLEESARPFVDVAGLRKALPRGAIAVNPYGRLVTLLEPSLISAMDAGQRVRAMARSLRVLSAIQSRAPGSGDATPKLSDLGLPPEATIDPFDGQPLRVKKSPRGWTVYSVGPNGLDDGGRLDHAIDIGVGPPGPEEPSKSP